MSDEQQNQAAFTSIGGFLTYIGELRAALAGVALLCVMLKPFASSEVRYHDWGLLPDVIAPVTVLILFWGLALDMLMSKVYSFSADEAGKQRFRLIIRMEALLVLALLLSWVPYYVAVLR